jgi:hypothetical protein
MLPAREQGTPGARRHPLDGPPSFRDPPPVPAESKFIVSSYALFVACAGAAAALGGCASSSKSQDDSHFAKSLRENEANKKQAPANSKTTQSATPSEFKLPGNRVYVVYHDAKLKKKMALVNSGAVDASEIYNTQKADPELFVKVAEDDLMADLYEAFRRLDFGKLADTAASARGETPQWTLTVDVDGNKKSVDYVRGRDVEIQRKLSLIQGAFLSGFNRVYGFRSVDADQGGKGMFKDEQQHLKDVKQGTLDKANKKNP